ncbi:MAG: hypothetical protein ACTSPM_09235 [Candidatus Heimdallarchaeota archaeon]
MTDKGDQTFFLSGKNSKIYLELDKAKSGQDALVKELVKQQIRPSNDIWIAYLTTVIGKLAKTVENNNQRTLESLIIKLIAQLMSWLELVRNDTLEDLTIKTTNIHNPAFNTVFVKLTGDLSSAILKNDNKTIQNKLVMFQAFCSKWIERLDAPSIKIMDEKALSKQEIYEEYWKLDEKITEDFEEVFAGLDLE